jgi:hypothetical protein
MISIVKDGITTKKGGLLFKELLLPRAVPGRPSSYYVGAEFCDRVDCSVIIDFQAFPSCIQCVNCHLIIVPTFLIRLLVNSFDCFTNCSAYVQGTIMFNFFSEFLKVASFFI